MTEGAQNVNIVSQGAGGAGGLNVNILAGGAGQGFLFGGVLSKSAATTVGVTTCIATDSTGATIISTGGAFTKTFAAFAAGTGNGGLDTGAIANNTWYHVFAISKALGASPDILISLSPTAPTMPATYTLFRRLGSIKTDATPNIIDFTQLGNTFRWKVNVRDVNLAASLAAGTLETLSVPTGVQVDALFSVLDSGATLVATIITSPDDTDQAPDTTDNFTSFHSASVPTMVGMMTCRTNTSGQIRYRANTATAAVLVIRTYGWTDLRGRYN